jgi:hypothetical protein
MVLIVVLTAFWGPFEWFWGLLWCFYGVLVINWAFLVVVASGSGKWQWLWQLLFFIGVFNGVFEYFFLCFYGIFEYFERFLWCFWVFLCIFMDLKPIFLYISTDFCLIFCISNNKSNFLRIKMHYLFFIKNHDFDIVLTPKKSKKLQKTPLKLRFFWHFLNYDFAIFYMIL